MKRLTIIPFALLLALTASSRLAAADPPSSFGLAPAAPQPLQPGQPAPPSEPAQPSEPASGVPLIPDGVQPTEKPTVDGPKKIKSNRTVLEDDRLHKRIKLRQAITKAQRDPGLQATMAKAYLVKTDFEQRQLFIDYYNGLCDRIEKIDPTLVKDEVEALRKAYTARYYEARIAPTVDPATFQKKTN